LEKAMLSLSWTNWPLFAVGLVQGGCSDAATRRVIGGATCPRVAEAVPAHSAEQRRVF